ncbi:unnamed protein product [Closterium sp. NIES-64]|nr:unnamed protein product [Closterium sp. NIES-64]
MPAASESLAPAVAVAVGPDGEGEVSPPRLTSVVEGPPPVGPGGKREWGRAVVGEKGSEAPLLESPTLQHQPQQLLDLRLYLLGSGGSSSGGANGKGEWGRLKRAAEALPLLAPVGPPPMGQAERGWGWAVRGKKGE